MEKLGLCINTSNFALTQWADLEFDSLVATDDGRLIGAGPSGVFIQDADTDNGAKIEAYIETVETDHGVRNVKKPYRAYFQGYTTGRLNYTITTGNGQSGTYPIKAADTDGSQGPMVAEIGVGLESQYFIHRIENVNGADFGIDTMDLLIMQTSRFK